MNTWNAYLLGFSHGVVICSACALGALWLARRTTIAKAAPLPESDTGGRDGR